MQKKDLSPHYPFILGALCFLAYVACYDGRSILSAIIPQMIQDTGFTKESLGLMGSAFFLTYGIGQVINGMIGDRVKARYMVSLGLLLAGLTLFIFPHITSALSGTILWGLCGLVLSMLWGPLSKVIAENIEEKKARLYMTGLSVASILGTMAAYFTATIASARQDWKLAFLLSGTVLVLCSVLWFFALGFLERKQVIRPTRRVQKEQAANVPILKIMLQNAIIPMIIVAVINGIIRNAVAFWIPTYIVEKLGVSPVTASSLSSILPIINLAGTFTGLFLYKKVKSNELTVSIIMFAFSTVMFLLMWIIDGRLFICTLVALFSASAAMSSVCNMIFSTYCLRFRHTGRVSTITGFLNFTSYASSSIASAVFSSIVTKSGWNTTVLTWAGLTVAGGAAAVWAFSSIKKHTAAAASTE